MIQLLAEKLEKAIKSFQENLKYINFGPFWEHSDQILDQTRILTFSEAIKKYN